jgi:flavodoxin
VPPRKICVDHRGASPRDASVYILLHAACPARNRPWLEENAVALSIVCYSNTGNNQVLADHLAERLQCGIARITESRRRSWLRTLLDLAFGWSPSIEPLHAPLDAYRHVILIGPVWASRLASPLRTFLAEHGRELGDYSFITLCGFARPEQKQRLTEELTRRVGHAPRAVCELPISDLLPRRQRDDVRVVTPYRISDDDLAEYDDRITAFLAEADIRSREVELAASSQ